MMCYKPQFANAYRKRPASLHAVSRFFVRGHGHGRKNQLLFGGKKAITFLASGAAAELTTINAIIADKQTVDFMFFNNVGNFGGNQMHWVEKDLMSNTAWWIKTYANRSATRNIVALYHGFNDASDADPTLSVWPGQGAVRNWSVDGQGPGLPTLLAQREAVIAGYKLPNTVQDII